MNMEIIKRTVGRSVLIIKKYSPEILMGAGVVGIISSTVMACKATLKVDRIIAEKEEKYEKIQQTRETCSEEYSEKDFKRDVLVVYTQTGVNFIKLYGPSITLGVASIACILGAHNIMRKRNIALIAAYKAVEQSFSDYRKRVVDEFGSEKDRMLKNGIRQEQITVTDENGKTTTETVDIMDPNGISQYARWFNAGCREWQEIPEYNLTFLKCQQNYANDLLNSRGHVFLNEIYDALGIPRTKEGAIVGWVKDHGDGFVDFGMLDNLSTYRSDRTCDTIGNERQDFVNGYANAVLLDFNVDGIIYDLI